MYGLQEKELLKFFLTKQNDTSSQNILKDFEFLEKVEREYLYSLLFEEKEEKKLEALEAYMARTSDIVQSDKHNTKKIHHIFSQMRELVESTNNSGDASQLLGTIED